MIILKFTKNQGFTHPLEDTFFEKTTGGSQIDLQIDLPFINVQTTNGMANYYGEFITHH